MVSLVAARSSGESARAMHRAVGITCTQPGSSSPSWAVKSDVPSKVLSTIAHSYNQQRMTTHRKALAVHLFSYLLFLVHGPPSSLVESVHITPRRGSRAVSTIDPIPYPVSTIRSVFSTQLSRLPSPRE